MKTKVGFYVVTLADDGTALVTYRDSGKLVFEGKAYDVARKLEDQARAFEQAKLTAQGAAAKLREYTRASTHPWEVWRADQWFDGEATKHGQFQKHASYKTQAAAERAAVKLGMKQRTDGGLPWVTAWVTEVRRAVPGSIL